MPIDRVNSQIIKVTFVFILYESSARILLDVSMYISSRKCIILKHFVSDFILIEYYVLIIQHIFLYIYFIKVLL